MAMCLLFSILMLPADATGQLIGGDTWIDCTMCAIQGVAGHRTMSGDSTSVYHPDVDGEQHAIHGCILNAFCSVHGADCDLGDGGGVPHTNQLQLAGLKV